MACCGGPGERPKPRAKPIHGRLTTALADGERTIMLHIQPLIQLAGPRIIPLLEQLMERDEQLNAELRLALRNAIEREANADQNGD
jgi:hypothetical protein